MLNNWKEIPARSPEYLVFIRQEKCLCCGITPCDPHHLKPHGKYHGSMGKKCSDFRAIPMCRIHHTEFHDHGKEYMENKYSLNLTEINIQYLEKYIEHLTEGKSERNL